MEFKDFETKAYQIMGYYLINIYQIVKDNDDLVHALLNEDTTIFNYFPLGDKNQLGMFARFYREVPKQRIPFNKYFLITYDEDEDKIYTQIFNNIGSQTSYVDLAENEYGLVFSEDLKLGIFNHSKKDDREK